MVGWSKQWPGRRYWQLNERSDTEFVSEESLENELDSDDEPLNLLVPEANYHVVENWTIKKLLKKVVIKLRRK